MQQSEAVWDSLHAYGAAHGGEAEWATEVAVPQDATGLYILLNAESGKQRLYANYAVDVTDK